MVKTKNSKRILAGYYITKINKLTGFDIATDNINAFKKGINQLTQQGNTQISPAKNNDDR